MAHVHPGVVTDTDKQYFIVDPVTRTITNTTGKTVLIKNDHNSECFTFEIPRYIDNHDMTKCNVVEIHFINIDGKTREQNQGVYRITADRNPDDTIIGNDEYGLLPDNSEKMFCRWLISRNVTKYAGTLNFAMRFVCTNMVTQSDGKEKKEVVYEWNTSICAGITVADTLYNSDDVAEPYDDILVKWYAELEQWFATEQEKFERRFSEVEQEVLAKEPIGIDDVIAGEPVISNSKTVTPVTVVKTDGTVKNFNVEAQNGSGVFALEVVDGELIMHSQGIDTSRFEINDQGVLVMKLN